MSNAMRGEPTQADVLAKIGALWPHAEQSLTRLLSNVLAAGGYSPRAYENILFIGMADSELLRCIDEFEKLLRRVGEWQATPPATDMGTIEEKPA